MARQPAPEAGAAGRAPVLAALLDYHRHPGKYSTALREPAVLFASIRVILQLAAGKLGHEEHSASLQRAAVFFIRLAVIFPGADHYTLLGVTRASDAATIKEHYRLMMRLVHPDFAAGPGSTWPSDAATRINLAYEILRSPEKRAEYEKSFSNSALAPASKARAPVAIAAKRTPVEPRVLVKQLAAGFGALGILGILALAVASHSEHDSVSLIQKESPGETLAAPERPVVQVAPPPSVQVAALMPSPTSPTTLPATATLATHPRAFAAPQGNAGQPAQTAMPPAAALLSSTVATASAPPISSTPILAPLPAPPVAPSPSPSLAAVAALASPPPPIAAAAQASATARAADIAVKPNPGLTLAQAQPLLAMLLQQVESGQGDRLLHLLERDARNAPAARALARQLDNLVGGAHPVSVANVEFRAVPADGRLFVVGHVRLQTGAIGAAAKSLALRIEFMSRDGTVVMTGLSPLAQD